MVTHAAVEQKVIFLNSHINKPNASLTFNPSFHTGEATLLEYTGFVTWFSESSLAPLKKQLRTKGISEERRKQYDV